MQEQMNDQKNLCLKLKCVNSFKELVRGYINIELKNPFKNKTFTLVALK